jgi:hypothetical protein
MSEATRRKRDERRRKLIAEVDALGTIDDDTLAAVRKLQAEESMLYQRLLDGELTEAR